MRTTDRGETWARSILPAGVGRLTGVSCPAKAFCVAVGETPDGNRGAALVTTNSGRVWTHLSLPTAEGSLALVSCRSVNSCVVVGGPLRGASVITTTNGGKSWARTSLPQAHPGTDISEGVTCPSSTRCFIVGGFTLGDGTPSGLVFTSSNRGKLWTSQSLPPGTSGLFGSRAAPDDLRGRGRRLRRFRRHRSHHNGCRTNLDASLGAGGRGRPRKRLVPDRRSVCRNGYQPVCDQPDGTPACGRDIVGWWDHLDERHPLMGLPTSTSLADFPARSTDQPEPASAPRKSTLARDDAGPTAVERQQEFTRVGEAVPGRAWIRPVDSGEFERVLAACGVGQRVHRRRRPLLATPTRTIHVGLLLRTR